MGRFERANGNGRNGKGNRHWEDGDGRNGHQAPARDWPVKAVDGLGWSGPAAAAGNGVRRERAPAGRPVQLAVVGYGYWGPNLVRNAIERPDVELAVLCERECGRIQAFRDRFQGVPVEREFERLLLDPGIDAIVVATPPATHYELVKAALQMGKHVLVEKPLATSTAEARELVELAEERGLVLMPGHTFLYSPAVNAIRDMIRDGVVGEVYFVTSSRMNLGKYQRDGVICDLAPHDLSILLYWLDQPIVQVAASARSVFRPDVPETAFLNLEFASGTAANIQISWLAPRKIRQTVVVGSKRMVLYDDTASDESVRLYDRGMDFDTPANFGEYQLTYRTGDVVIPRIDAVEPLSLELEDFARAIRERCTPRSHAGLGLEIVGVLEAAEISLREGGAPQMPECAGAAAGTVP